MFRQFMLVTMTGLALTIGAAGVPATGDGFLGTTAAHAGLWGKIKKGAKKVGRAAKKVGRGAKQAAKKVGRGAKRVVKSQIRGAKEGWKVTKKFFKEGVRVRCCGYGKIGNRVAGTRTDHRGRNVRDHRRRVRR